MVTVLLNVGVKGLFKTYPNSYYVLYLLILFSVGSPLQAAAPEHGLDRLFENIPPHTIPGVSDFAYKSFAWKVTEKAGTF